MTRVLLHLSRDRGEGYSGRVTKGTLVRLRSAGVDAPQKISWEFAAFR